MRKCWVIVIVAMGYNCMGIAASASLQASRIQSLLSSQAYEALIEDDETYVTTKLGKSPNPPFLETYQAGAAFTINAPVSVTRDILTRYEVYEKLIPFIDDIKVIEAPAKVAIEGGILGWKMLSLIQFHDKDPGWIHFVVTHGSSAGMEGDFYFEAKRGHQNTSLVYFRVMQSDENFPPRFIMESGANMILRSTANKMREYIESR